MVLVTQHPAARTGVSGGSSCMGRLLSTECYRTDCEHANTHIDKPYDERSSLHLLPSLHQRPTRKVNQRMRAAVLVHLLPVHVLVKMAEYGR